MCKTNACWVALGQLHLPMAAIVECTFAFRNVRMHVDYCVLRLSGILYMKRKAKIKLHADTEVVLLFEAV
jgi:hypothetical protein